MQVLQRRSVTLFNFSQELSALGEDELQERARTELEAFGALSGTRLVSGKDRRVVAYYANPESAEDAVKGLGDPAFDLPFQIKIGIQMSAIPGVLGIGGIGGIGAGGASGIQAQTPPWGRKIAPRVCRVQIYIDDLDMPKRPDVPPGSKDSEVWIDPMPDPSPNEDTHADWLAPFGKVQSIFRVPSSTAGPLLKLSHKAYVHFETHEAALACVNAGVGTWSESERILAWQKRDRSSIKDQSKDHAYPFNIVSAFLGVGGAGINDLRVACGVFSLKIMGIEAGGAPGKFQQTAPQIIAPRTFPGQSAPKPSAAPKPPAAPPPGHHPRGAVRLHFEIDGDENSIANVKPELERRLAEIHGEITDYLKNQGLSAFVTKRGNLMPVACVIYIDELRMPDRPDAEPSPFDREVWVQRTPSDDDLEEWKSAFGAVEEVFRVPSAQSDSDDAQRGYVLFEKHVGAKRCVDAGIGDWSESERAMAQRTTKAGKKNAYPRSIVGWFLKDEGANIKDVTRKCGAHNVRLGRDSTGGTDKPTSKRLHFLVGGAQHVPMEDIHRALEEKISEYHQEIQPQVKELNEKKAAVKETKRKRRMRQQESKRARLEAGESLPGGEPNEPENDEEDANGGPDAPPAGEPPEPPPPDPDDWGLDDPPDPDDWGLDDPPDPDDWGLDDPPDAWHPPAHRPRPTSSKDWDRRRNP